MHSCAKSHTEGLERSVVLGGLVTRACGGVWVSAVLPAAHHFGLQKEEKLLKMTREGHWSCVLSADS